MAELMGQRWVAVEEKYRGICTVSCFMVEEIEAADRDIAYLWFEAARYVIRGIFRVLCRVSEHSEQSEEKQKARLSLNMRIPKT